MKDKIKKQILKRKEKKNAGILSHYYFQDGVETISDYVGYSFYLAKIAKLSGTLTPSAPILNPSPKNPHTI